MNLKLTKKTLTKKKKKTLKQTTHTDHSRFRLGRDPSFPSEFSRQRFTVGVIPLVSARQRFPVRVLGRDPFRGERAKPLTQTTHKKKREKQSNENHSRQKKREKHNSQEPLTRTTHKKNGKGKPLTKTTHANHSRFRLGRDLGRRPVTSGSRPRVGDHIV